MKSTLFCLGFLLFTSSPVFAAQARLHLGLDLFTVGNGDDGWNDTAEESIDSLVYDIGYDSARYEMETSPGLGARVGLRFPFESNSGAYLGVSLGYVKGPESDTTVTADSTIAGRGVHEQNAETSFIRFLFEIGKTFPLSGTSKFALGAGVGVAQGTIEANSTNSGSFVSTLGLPRSESDNKTWTGFTWEINPSLMIPSGTTEIELGARIAGFPTLEKSDDWSEFSWTPLGLYAALHF